MEFHECASIFEENWTRRDVANSLRNHATGVGGGIVVQTNNDLVTGVDAYNFKITGQVACTLNATSCDSPSHSGPSVIVLNDQDVKCFRKTAHPRCADGYQGWEETRLADTLNVYDNSESRTPVVICLEGNGARPSHRGGGYSEDGRMFTLNTIERHVVCYGISPYESNAMKSSNPHSGIYEAKTSRTLDLNGGNPSCNQGGIIVCYAIDSHPEDSRFQLERGVTPTITVKIAKGSADGPLVLVEHEVLHDREPSGRQQSED